LFESADLSRKEPALTTVMQSRHDQKILHTETIDSSEKIDVVDASLFGGLL
jgi:hypothetical protein